MTARALRVVWFVSTALTVSGCFDPLYDERDSIEGELVVCCDTTKLALARHPATKGENFTMRIFPACECIEGPGCQPLYTAAPWGCTQFVMGSFSDAGVSNPSDGGTTFDAGTTADAGTPYDAGAPGPSYWSACCIDSNLVSCQCSEFGPCVAAEFKLCDSMSCTLGNTCPAN